MANHYDYIILGAGAAGLSLAYYMSSYPELSDTQVLIIDQAPKNQNDRTWTFWGDPPADFAHLVRKTWYRVGLYNQTEAVEDSIADLPYHYIAGDAFYTHTLNTIQAQSQFTFLRATVEDVEATEGQPLVYADGKCYTAPYVFNSAFPGTGNLSGLKDTIAFQRFKGWEVAYDEPVIDPDQLTLMDFSTNPADDLRFIYVLPLSPYRLIINCTAFGHTNIPKAFYDEQMAEYLHHRISEKPYTITRHEGGMIPMSHLPLQRYYGDRVINLGVLGGDTRASTGYTFIHAIRNGQSLARQLAAGKAPVALEHRPRHAFYDRIFLHVLANHPKALEQGLIALFRRNPAERVFRFLSGNTALYEELPLILSLPIRPFVQGLLNMLKKPEIPYARTRDLSKASN